jgi:hypothetical protein
MKFALQIVALVMLLLNAITVQAQDECTNATVITPGSSCTYSTLDLPGTLTRSASLPGTCNGAFIVDDAWIRFTATSGVTVIQYQNTNRDAALWGYSGSCAGLSLMGCSDNWFVGTEVLTLPTTSGQTYWVRIGRLSGNNSATMNGSICVIATSAPSNDNPCSSTALTVNPTYSYATYSNYAALPTTGVTAPGCGNYVGGDVWFTVTVPTSGAVSISTETGVVTDAAMAVYTGASCSSLTLVACGDNGFGSNGFMPRLNFTCYAPGTILYVRVWDVYNAKPGTFQIAAMDLGGTPTPPSNDEPCAAIDLPVNSSCTYTTYTNQCGTASAGITAPGCAGYLGADVWFKVVVPISGTVVIDSKESVMTDGGMAIYTGSCSSLTLLSCDDNTSANGNMPSLTVSGRTPGEVLYVRYWENGNNNNGPFGLCVSDPCPGGIPVNDDCSNAIKLSLGIPTTGRNGCATSTGEPANPSCWTTTGTLNTVWYVVTAPASGRLSIRTQLGTLINTQIQVFSGTCGSLTSIGCSNDIALCGNSQQWSEVILTGLVSGTNYYVRVDGTLSLIGQFAITAIDGNNQWPTAIGQDCNEPFPLCSSTITVGDPGFIGSGNYCDYPGNAGGCSNGSCIVAGERNSIWYSFSALSNGSLTFTINPSIPVDYDWALYNVTGLTNPCSTLATGTLAPIRCSYWGGTGPTGLSAIGTENCDGTSGTLDGYAAPFTMTANNNYYLFISNFSTTTFVGYNLNFNASPINYNSNNVVWTGGSSTEWSNVGNWGGCAIPDCNRNANIYGGTASQPIIQTGQTFYCNDLTIHANATLTLKAGATLYICGNYTNYGILNADPTSNIYFQNSGTQVLEGSMVGNNKFGNLFFTKNGGTATLKKDIDIVGNLTLNTTGGATFSLNSFYTKLSGNLVNSTSSLVVPNGSTIEFNGTSNQSYTHGSTELHLKDVLINKASGTLDLNSDFVIADNGLLTLANGRINTGTNFTTRILNPSTSSILGGGVNSYIEGNLFRKLSGAVGTYYFPVGNATKGQQLGSIEFTTSTSATDLTARFDNWTTVPYGPVSSECLTANYSLLPLFNNGYWTFTPSPLSPSGTYNIMLESRAQTNASAIGGFTIVKSIDGGSSWILDGTCVTSSTASSASRTGLSGFGQFGIGQVSSPLPIELISFTAAEKEDYNLLEWVTLAEVNNEVFTLERSSNKDEFYPIGTVPGAGNSKVVLSYSFKDMKPLSGVSYYRLRQTDYDGTSTTSRIIAIRRRASETFSVIASPNISKGIFNLTVSASTTGMYKLKVTDAAGKGIINDQVEISGDHMKLPLDLTSFQSGLYNLTLEEPISGESIVIRLVRQ